MANEFKIRKGLIVTGASGGTVVDIQGSQGQLFSVTDNLSGSIFAVSDISGVPIFDVNSSGLVTIDGSLTSNGIITAPSFVSSTDSGININGITLTKIAANSSVRVSNGLETLGLLRSYDALIVGTTATISGNLFVAGGTSTLSGAFPRFNLYSTDAGEDDYSIINNNGIFGVYNNTQASYFLSLAETSGNATFSAQAFSAATSSGDGSSTLTTKGYVDGLITGATIYRGAWDPSGGGYGSPDLSTVTQTSGYYYICSADGTAEPNGTGTEPDTWAVGDWVIYNDVSGTGQWQKIDNSSVLSGVGTGQTVALWEGAGSVTDSETLGNAPITVSGNNATFAGNVLAEGSLITRSVNANVTISGDTSGNIYYNNASGEHRWRASGSSVNSMNLSSTLLTVNEPAYFTSILGVGTQAPVADLQVLSTKDGMTNGLNTNQLKLSYGASVVGAGSSVAFGVSSNLNFTGAKIVHERTASNSVGDLTFWTRQTGGTSTDYDLTIERMRIKSDGNIQLNAYGAGTLVTDASGNITVSSGGGAGGPYLPLSAGSSYPLTGPLNLLMSNDPKLILQCTSTATSDWNYINFVGRDTVRDGYVGTDGDGDMQVYSDKNSSYLALTPSGIILANGNVGIGTTNPNDKLDVTDGNSKMVFGGASSDRPLLYFQHNAVPVDGEEIGLLDFRGYNDASQDTRYVILTAKAEDVTDGSEDGSLTFRTMKDGTATQSMTLRSGNVGIGVTSPGNKLSVTGTGRVFNATSTSDEVVASITRSGGSLSTLGFNGTGSTSDYHVRIGANATSFVAYTSNTERMRIIANGNVGIGTTSPAQNFVVADATLGNGIELVPGATATIQAYNRGSSSYNNLNLDIARLLVRSFDYTTINTGSALTERMRWLADGQFWIKLNSTTSGREAAMSNDEDKLRIFGSRHGGTGKYVSIWSDGANENARFYSTNTVFYKNVGINATSPNSRLDVRRAGSGVALELHQTSGSANDYVDLKMIAGNTNAGTFGTILRHKRDGSGGGDFSILTNPTLTGTPTEKLTVKSNGNVGIGTSTPLAKLDIQGTQGQLFSVTDDLSGSIFAVSDISGVPIFDVNSSGVSYFDGKVEIGTLTGSSVNSQANQLWLKSTENNGITISSGNSKTGTIFFGDVANSAAAGFRYNHNTGDMAISAEDNVTFACDNVGIGVTGPVKKLHVSDSATGLMTNLLLTNTNDTNGDTTGIAFSMTDNDLYNKAGIVFERQTTQGRGSLHFCNNNTNGSANFTLADAAMTIEYTGEVGIGTPTPVYKLDVVSAGDGLLSLTGANKPAMIFKVGTAVVGGIQAQINTSLNVSAYGTSSLNLQTAGTTPRLTILNGGAVGIGTISPIGLLEVRKAVVRTSLSSTSADELVIQNTDYTGITILAGSSHAAGIHFGDAAASNAGMINYFNNDNSMQFTTNGSLKMVIKSSGNVGIGTTNPATQLEIYNDNDQPATLRLSSTLTDGDDVAAIISFSNDAGGGGVQGRIENIATEDDTTVFKFYNDNSSSPSMTLNDSGNMTIAGTLTQNSDVRLKENIKPIESALDKVKQMQGVEFNKINSSTKEIGVVAQEVEKIIPELVLEDKEGIKSVAYGNITAVLIEAIKEQQKQIEELKQQLNK